MTAPDDRRHDLTDRMADFVLAHGLAAASLRPLAAAAGISDRMLIYYFTDKARALDAAFARVMTRLQTALATRRLPAAQPIGRLRGKLIAVLLDADLWPYLQLWLEVTALAARGDPVQRERGLAIRSLLEAWVQDQLLADDPNPRARLMAMIQSVAQQHALGLRDSTPD